MSTKTTFKRVALVAVAAVGLGLLTAVPSNAATTPGLVNTQGTGTTLSTQVVGGQAAITLTVDTSATLTNISNVTVSGVGSVVSVAAGVPGIISTPNAIPAGATSWSDSAPTGAGLAPTQVITLTSSVVGTTTVSYVLLDANGTPGTAKTATVTWVAALATGILDHSTAYLGSGTLEAGTGGYATPLTAALSTSPYAYSGSSVANISVRQYASAIDSTTALLDSASKAVVVTISGAGAVDTFASNGATRGAVATIAAAGQVSGLSQFRIFPDGRPGTATITATVNGVTVGTWSYKFVGAVASIAMNVDATPKTLIGVGDTDAIQFDGFDSAANQTPAVATLVATSGSPLIAAASAATTGVVTVTGVAEGTSVITVSVGALATAKITQTFTVTVTKTTATVVALSFDKASYAPGEKMILTVSAKTSTGTAVADGTRTVFTTVPTANVSLQGFTTLATTVALVGGVKSYTMYAPLLAGDVVVSGTDNASTPVAISATATVSGGDAAAALDAANEATDAANYAADAADAATTAAEEATAAANAAGDAATAAQASADAALAAVTDLGLKVTGLISALRAQITSLTNLIVKIQKKVNA